MEDIQITDKVKLEFWDASYTGDDALCILVKDDIMLKISIPKGHSLDDVWIEKSDGESGWQLVHPR